MCFGLFVEYMLFLVELVLLIDMLIVEVLVFDGLFGVKGVGELLVVVVFGAIVNVIVVVLGVCMCEFLMMLMWVWDALCGCDLVGVGGV